MREVVLRIPRLGVEDILDRLLPIVPDGVRVVPAGRHVELLMRGSEVPAADEIAAAVGRWPHKLSEREISDDWRERRLADYEPDVIAGRLVVRPDWAPPPTAAAPPMPAAPSTPAAPPVPSGGVIDIVLHESAAFGGGGHPTTRTCLELLLGLEPRGGFADLGCGTGVLAILAARLGWAPVVAVDLEPGSIQTAMANAGLNGVEIDARVLDLTEQPPPAAEVFAANVPPAVHAAVAAGFGDDPPQTGILSGFAPPETDEVLDAYAARGLHERRRAEAGGWVVVVLDRS